MARVKSLANCLDNLECPWRKRRSRFEPLAQRTVFQSFLEGNFDVKMLDTVAAHPSFRQRQRCAAIRVVMRKRHSRRALRNYGQTVSVVLRVADC